MNPAAFFSSSTIRIRMAQSYRLMACTATCPGTRSPGCKRIDGAARELRVRRSRSVWGRLPSGWRGGRHCVFVRSAPRRVHLPPPIMPVAWRGAVSTSRRHTAKLVERHIAVSVPIAPFNEDESRGSSRARPTPHATADLVQVVPVVIELHELYSLAMKFPADRPFPNCLYGTWMSSSACKEKNRMRVGNFPAEIFRARACRASARRSPASGNPRRTASGRRSTTPAGSRNAM